MHFDFHALVATYGYLAIFIGSLLDGEGVVLLSGLLSHEDYLSFPWIIFWAFCGVISNDAFWFLLGRYKGEQILEKWIWFRKLMGTPVALVGKKPKLLSFLMRFMYGFRQIVPFSLGMSSLKTRSFFLWNSLGAVTWVLVFGGMGYILGDVLESFVGKLRKYELMLIVFVVLVVVAVHMVSHFFRNILKKVVDQNEK